MLHCSFVCNLGAGEARDPERREKQIAGGKGLGRRRRSVMAGHEIAEGTGRGERARLTRRRGGVS